MAHPHPYDLLIKAHRAGGFQRFQQLFNGLAFPNGLDISLRHPVRNWPFLTLLAAQPNSSEAVQWLLNDWCESEHRNLAVLGAALGDQLDCMKMLLDSGADPGVAIMGRASRGHLPPKTELMKGSNLNCAVDGAAWGNKEDLLNQLLKEGGSIDFAVQGYARADNEQKVEYFLKRGADIGFAIRGAAQGCRDALALQLFKLENQIFEANYDALLNAACAQDWERVEAIIEAGFVIDRIHSKFGCPVIAMLASKPDSMQAVKALTDKFSHPSWAIFGAAMGCQRELLKYLMLTFPGYREFAIKGAIKGGHEVLQAELTLVEEDPQFVSMKYDVIDIAEFRGDYTAVIENPPEPQDSTAYLAACGGHRALVHWIIHRKLYESYEHAVNGAARGGHLKLLMEFTKLQAKYTRNHEEVEELDDPPAVGHTLNLAASHQQGRCVEWLLMEGANIGYAEGEFLDLLLPAANLLARIHDSKQRAAVANFNNTDDAPPVLTQALPLANIMVRHELTAPEAKLLFDHAKVLQVLLNERWVQYLIPAEVKRKIACYAVGHPASGFGLTQMVNVQTTLQNAFMRAKKMCALRQSPENFNGAALHFWIQDCANDLKGQMWPSMQAKGRDLEALLTAIAIPVNTLDAEEMLNALERQNDAGQSIRSLLEPLRYWKDLLSRFPSIAEQVSLPRAEKRLKYAC